MKVCGAGYCVVLVLVVLSMLGCDHIYEFHGKRLYKRGEYDAAARAFVNAIHANSNRPAFYWWCGRACKAMGSNDLALTHFAYAADLAASNAQYHLDHALLLHQSGRTNHAIDAYSAAIAHAERSFTARVERARCLYTMKRYPQALLDATEALELSPSNGPVLLLRANTLRRQRAFRAAMDDCRAAMELDPRWSEPYLAAGSVAEDAGRPVDALGLFTEAIARSNTYAWAYYRRAAVQYERHNYALALPDFRTVTELDPAYFHAWQLLGICLQECNQPEQALEVFDEVLKRKPGYANCYYERAHALKDLERYDEALSNLFICLSIESNHFSAIHNVGYCYRRKKNFAAAIPWFERILQSHPRNALAMYNLGCCYTELGNCDAAVEYMSDAVRVSPDYYDAYEYRAYLYHYRTRDLRRAAMDYMEMARLRHNDVSELRNILAKVSRCGVDTAVVFVADAILTHEPGDAHAYASRAWCKLSDEGLSNAVADAALAVKLDPKCDLAYNALSRAFRLQGDYRAALSNLEVYIALTSNDAPRHLYNYGCLLNAVGRYSDAIPQLTRSMTSEPTKTLATIERAHAYAALGIYSNALADVHNVPERWCSHCLWRTSAVAHFGLGEYGNAVKDCTVLVKSTQAEDQARVRAVRARAYSLLGMTNEASADVAFCTGYGIDTNIAVTSILQRVDRF